MSLWQFYVIWHCVDVLSDYAFIGRSLFLCPGHIIIGDQDRDLGPIIITDYIL